MCQRAPKNRRRSRKKPKKKEGVLRGKLASENALRGFGLVGKD